MQNQATDLICRLVFSVLLVILVGLLALISQLPHMGSVWVWAMFLALPASVCVLRIVSGGADE